jgi:hypothetical protein
MPLDRAILWDALARSPDEPVALARWLRTYVLAGERFVSDPVRGQAIAELAARGDDVVDPLLVVVRDWGEALAVRRLAVDALVARGDRAPAVFDALRAFLDDPGFRESTTDDDDPCLLWQHLGWALGRLGQARVRRLADGLESPAPWATQVACAIALRDILDRGRDAVSDEDRSYAVARLTAVLERRKWSETELVEPAIRALGAAGAHATGAVPVLVEALGAAVLGDYAETALSFIGPAAVPGMIAGLATVRPVFGGWAPPDWDTHEPRYALARLIAAIGPASVAPLAAAARVGADPEARYFAIVALDKCADSERCRPRVADAAEPCLIDALATYDTAEPYATAHVAAVALGKVGTARCVPALEALAAMDAEAAESAAEALAKVRARLGPRVASS